jgi:hypothetical protein
MNERVQNGATFPITFVMVTTDHITKATGLSPVVTLSKNGLAFGAALGAVTELGSGWYALAGNATDRNTLGELAIHATAAGADDCDMKYVIIPWDPFNGVNLGMTSLPGVGVNTTGGLITSGTGANQLSTTNGTVTAGTIQDKSGYSLATPPPTAGAIADAVWDEARSGHANTGTFGSYLDAAISGIAGGSGGSGLTAADVWGFDIVAAGYTGNQAGGVVARSAAVQTRVRVTGSPGQASVPLVGVATTLPTAPTSFLGQWLEVETGANAGQRKAITSWSGNTTTAGFDAPGFPYPFAAGDLGTII